MNAKVANRVKGKRTHATERIVVPVGQYAIAIGNRIRKKHNGRAMVYNIEDVYSRAPH